MRLQLLSDHRVDGHQAEDAGLPHAALGVVVALQQTALSETLQHSGGPPESLITRQHKVSHLQEPRCDVRQQLVERLLGDAFDGPRLHLDGGQVDGVVCRLHDGTEDLDALLWVDGARQRGGRLLRRTHHLQRPKRGESVMRGQIEKTNCESGLKRCSPPCASLCEPPASS